MFRNMKNQYNTKDIWLFPNQNQLLIELCDGLIGHCEHYIA
jgi:hypothetical protein